MAPWPHALAALVLAATLAGCAQTLDHHQSMMGDGHGHSHMPGATGQGWGTLPLDGTENITFTIVAGSPDEFRYMPDAMEAQKGQRVGLVLVNNGTAPHELDIPAFGFHLHAEPGQTASGAFVAETSGTFEFACHVPGHYEAGMKGVLTVAA